MATSKRKLRTQVFALSNEERDVLTKVVRYALKDRWDLLANKAGELHTASMLLDQLEHAIDIEVTVKQSDS